MGEIDIIAKFQIRLNLCTDMYTCAHYILYQVSVLQVTFLVQNFNSKETKSSIDLFKNFNML